MGGDRDLWEAQLTWSAFQSTPPHGGRPSGSFSAGTAILFQSTPPHGGRPQVGGALDAVDEVSIHAPAWGATSSAAAGHEHGTQVSIHAPAWGATSLVTHLHPIDRVSIHAPAWGATDRGGGGWLCHRGFNPRPRVGGDPVRAEQSRSRIVSIHAPAWGATRSIPPEMSGWGVFQSTPPHGGRPSRTGRSAGVDEVSIHAPAWGATALEGPSSWAA